MNPRSLFLLLTLLAFGASQDDAVQDPATSAAGAQETAAATDPPQDKKKEWGAKFLEGVEQLRRRQLGLAQVSFEAVLAAPGGEASAPVLAQAQVLLDHTKAKIAAGDTKGFWGEILEQLQKGAYDFLRVVIWILIGLGAIAIFRLLRRFFRGKRDTQISLDDLTVAVDAREAAGQELTRAVAQEFRSLASAEVDGLAMAGGDDIQGADLVNIERELSSVATLAAHIDDTPVRVGMFQISSKQILQLVGEFLKPRYKRTITGGLMQAAGATVLSVQGQDKRGRPELSARAEASGIGDAAKQQVIREVAAQIVIDTAGVKATRNWRSLLSYVDALEILATEASAENRSAVLTKAQVKLQEAIQYDPANWMARFRLADVLMKVGQTEAADDQFNYLYDRMLQAGEKDAHLQAFLRQNSDFVWIVRHKQTLAMSRQGNRSVNRLAIKYLDELEVDVRRSMSKGDGFSVTDIKNLFTSQDDLNHIIMLIRAARATAWAIELEFLWKEKHVFQNDDPGIDKAMAEAVGHIAEDEEILWKQLGEVRRGLWPVYAKSHATAQNARGRAHYLMGEYPEAEKFFKWALYLHMPLNYAEAFANLGGLYLKWQGTHLTSRDAEAKTLLEKAIVLSPGHTKAHHMLGNVYRREELHDADKAIEHYRKAGKHPATLYCLGQVLLEEKGDEAGAADALRESIAVDPRPDDRFDMHLGLVRKLGKDEAYPTYRLEEARDMAERLHNAGINDGLKDSGRKHLQALKKLLKAREDAA